MPLEDKFVHYRIQRVLDFFGSNISKTTLLKAEQNEKIPLSQRQEGRFRVRSWPLHDLGGIGQRFGYLARPKHASVFAVFAMKGGVLKTTIALNLARVAALHGIRTCIVGLDIQADMSNALGISRDFDDASTLADVLNEPLRKTVYDVFDKKASLDEVLISVEHIPTLSVIAESGDLSKFERGLMQKSRREYWMKEHVIDPLRQKFDLIIMDCSPSWTQVTTNALAACDVLISPFETKVNHFRNHADFLNFVTEFFNERQMDPTRIVIPTRFVPTRSLASEIRQHYLTTVAGCTVATIRESVTGEEAMAKGISVPEYAPSSVPANEMRDLIREVWARAHLPLME